MLDPTSLRLIIPLRKLVTAARVIRRRPHQFWPLVRQNLFPSKAEPERDHRYAKWIAHHERSPKRPSFVAPTDRPIISVLMVVTRSRASMVWATLRSLEEQSLPAWQLVLGALDLPEAERAALVRNASSEGKIVFAPSGGATLGAALGMAADAATGDFMMVLEPGDTLPQRAIATFAKRLRGDPDIDILYADEDVLDGGLRTSPQFKPEWSPDLLTAYNYFGRPTVMRRSLVREVGSFAVDLGAAAEWDLHLRATRPFSHLVATSRIRRHAEVLCHRHPTSGNGHPGPEDPASRSFREALVRHWRREGIAAKVTTEADGTQHAVWEIAEPPLVSVIIPNKDHADLLSVCLDGLWERTAYPRLEVIVVDNGSTERDTLALYEESKKKGARIIPYNERFNYSRACNIGASAATGRLLLFLNNDIEVISPDWLTELVRFALRPGVGVVGTKLVYSNGALQHAGVVVGLDFCGLVFTSAPEHEWGVFGSPSVPRNWMGVMGACQMVRRDVFERIGGFDECLMIAASDVMLCMNAWRAGYRTVYAPHGKLIHHEGRTRGHTNPEGDLTRAAAAIRALGIDGDPYYHPGLSGTTPIPALRLGTDPAVAENLKREIQRRAGPTIDRVTPDLFDDAAMAVATRLSRNQILWEPEPPGSLPDARSAARFMIDLLRRRPDVAKRFPNALSGGADGGFAVWLKNGALTRFGYPPDAARSINAAFRADLAGDARRAVTAAAEREGGKAFLLLSVGRRVLARVLFDAVARGEVSKEGAWWFLLQTWGAASGSDAGLLDETDLEVASG